MTSHDARRQRLRRRSRMSARKLVTLGAILGLTGAVVGIPDWLAQSQPAVASGAPSGDDLRWSIAFPAPSEAQPSQ